MKTKFAKHTTLLNFENLETRWVLSATAVGTFVRIDGSVSSSSSAVAHASDETIIVSDQQSDADEVLARSSATAIAKDPGGFGFAHNDGTALLYPPIGGTIPVPQVSTSGITQITVTGLSYGSGGSGAGGGASFAYIPDPNFTQNLQTISHLFIAISGGEIENEHANVDADGVSARAAIGDTWISAQRFDENTFRVTSSSDLGFDYYSVGGVNLHVFQVASGVTNVTLNANNDAVVTGFSSGGGFGELQWSQAAAAWAFVTGQGQQPTLGDFNFDGEVDDLDYEVWADGQPQADVTPVSDLGGGVTVLDGIVDVQDYAVWAANADAILVSTNIDENDGNYSYGDLSLREAIALAADVNHPGSDIIAFDVDLVGSTITLTSGRLNIGGTNPVKILGPGADQLTINGNGGMISIFNVTGGGGAAIESTIAHLKLTGTGTFGTGVTHSDSNGNHDLVLDSLEIVDNGTGVRHTGSGQLVIRDSFIADNYADGVARNTSSPPADYASVTIVDSVVRDNGLSGITLRNLDVSISGSEISGNNTRSLLGKGINFQSNDDNPSVTLTIGGSTIAENNGPGIAIDSDTVANIFNTTISSNDGLGLSVTDAAATLTNVTVTQNRVATSGATAGVYAGTGGTITMLNTIVAQNFSGTGGSEVDADLGKSTTSPAGSFAIGTSSYNLIGVVGNSGLTSSNNNIILNGADAGLTALGDYGGKTRTHALLLTSLAIDAGDESKAEAIDLLYDQRGEGYDRIVDRETPNEPGLDIDIGAFEVGLGELYA